jgi:predicted metal-dependent hydrolase
MNIAVVIIIIFLIIYAFIIYWRTSLKYGAYNTKSVAPCLGCEKYQVHREHGSEKEAAGMLAEINNRNEKLIEYLGKKYDKEPSVQLDPEKNNRIDIIPGTELYDNVEMMGMLKNPMHREYLQERIEQLVQNYNSKYIYEISPKNTDGATSYTEDKKVLVLCLRHKKPNSRGEYMLHDINTMMFVVIHELSHMANKTWGHAVDFWVLFKFLLLNAVEAGIYDPVDYKKYPINYCGLWLHYNPIFDDSI